MKSWLIRHSLVALGVRVFGLGLAFATQIMLARMLGLPAFGLYSIALSWALLLTVPARFGSDYLATRYASVYRSRREFAELRALVWHSFRSIGVACATIATVVAAAWTLGPDMIKWPPFAMVLAAGVVSASLAMLGWLTALIRTADRPVEAQLYEQLFRPALLCAAVGTAVLLGWMLTPTTAMTLTAAALVVVTGVAIVRMLHDLPPSGAPADQNRRGEWHRFGWFVLAQGLVNEALNQSDIIMLGLLANSTQAALFTGAVRLSVFITFGLSALAYIAGPLLANSQDSGDHDRLGQAAGEAARLGTLFALVLAVVYFFFGGRILTLLGAEFAAAEPILWILVAGGLVNAMTGVSSLILLISGYQRSLVTYLCLSLVIDIALNLVLIPRMGGLGAAISAAIALAIWNLLSCWKVWTAMKVNASALSRSRSTLRPTAV